MGQYSCDFAVVAAGPAGLAAACAAAEKGVDVIVLEKNARVGGAGSMGMGILAVGSHIQNRQGTPVDPAEAFLRFMDFTHWRADPELVHAYFDKSADTLRWLEDMGVEFVGAAGFAAKPSIPTWHVVKPDSGLPGPGCADAMNRKMAAHAQALGVRILLKTPAIRILKEGGRICGVVARQEDGAEVTIRAKAVLIATGGCGNNKEMVYEHTGYTYGVDYFGHLVPGAEGDGLKMAWEAGCGRTPVQLELSKKTPVPLNSLVNQACNLPSLLIDRLGKRIMNEDLFMNGPFTGNALARHPGRMGFLLFDSDQARAVEEQMKHPPAGMFNVRITSNSIEEEVRKLEQTQGHIFGADTLEELADKAGIDTAGLIAAVERYNGFCDAGVDTDFYKSSTSLHPIRTPRFYAAEVYGGGYGTLGGIRANVKMEVEDPEGAVIPGFYAAGNEVCTIYCGTYYMNMPGNSMGFAVNSGRIAGENAADYIQSQ